MEVRIGGSYFIIISSRKNNKGRPALLSCKLIMVATRAILVLYFPYELLTVPLRGG